VKTIESTHPVQFVATGGRAVNEHQITRVLQAFYGNAWLIEPAKFAAIAEFIDARGTGALLESEQIRAAVAGRREAVAAVQQPVQGIGVIPITDVLVHRTYAVSNWSGGTSTEQLGRTVDAMMADPAITAIVLEIDSPGGMYEGTRELADKIAAAAKLNTKRIVALANGYAASGAYWLGVSAQQFFSIPSGEVGSIGVIQMHVDQSGLDAKVGVKRTLMRAGKFKAEGHPYGPLDDEAVAAIQQRLDEIYAEFVGAVADGRRVPSDTVISDFGEGRMVPAGRAAAADMIDGILTFDQLIAAIVATPRGQFIRVTSPAAAASQTRTPAPGQMIAASARDDERRLARARAHQAAHGGTLAEALQATAPPDAPDPLAAGCNDHLRRAKAYRAEHAGCSIRESLRATATE